MLLEDLFPRVPRLGTTVPLSLLLTKHGLFMLLMVLGMQIPKEKLGMFAQLGLINWFIRR